MSVRCSGAPESLLRDRRRNSWILVLPLSAFTGVEDLRTLDTPVPGSVDFDVDRGCRLRERVVTAAMVLWAAAMLTSLFCLAAFV